MHRMFLIVVLLGLVAVGVVLLAGGVVYLGLFPPNPAPHAVEKTLPNDRFQPKG